MALTASVSFRQLLFLHLFYLLVAFQLSMTELQNHPVGERATTATKDNLMRHLQSFSVDVNKGPMKFFSPMNDNRRTLETERRFYNGVNKMTIENKSPKSRPSQNGYIHHSARSQEKQLKSIVNKPRSKSTRKSLKGTATIFDGNADKDITKTKTTLFGSFNRYENIKDGSDDYFKCPPCSCYLPQGDASYGSVANCSSLNFTYPVKGVPNSLPSDVKYINMSFNSLEVFDFASVVIYGNLRKLDLENNKIHNLKGKIGKRFNVSNLEDLALDDNFINKIVNGTFCLTPRLKRLTMSNNSITTISNRAFICLIQLEYLDLSNNAITHIHGDALTILNQLKYLHINNNPELGYSIPLNIRGLRHLSFLAIQGNSAGHLVYPHQLFSSISKVKSLHIDGLGGNGTLGPLFPKVIHLRALQFGPNANCNFKYLPSTIFQNLPSLNSLTFDHCDFKGIDHEAFRHMPNLGIYHLAYIKSYDLNKAFQSLQGFHNSSLHTLSFVGLYHRASICVTLTSEHGKYLKGLTLGYLDLSYNRLALLQDGFLSSIPETLQTLKLVGNKFTITTNFLSKIHYLSNLRNIDMANQIREEPEEDEDEDIDQYCLNSVDASEEAQDKGCYITQEQNEISKVCGSSGNTNQGNTMRLNDERYHNKDVIIQRRNTSNSLINGDTTRQKTKGVANDKYYNKMKNAIILPPNLKTLSASEYPFFAKKILFGAVFFDNKLDSLDLSYNFVHNWGDGKLPINVHQVTLSHNHGETLSKEFFQPSNRLRYLFLEHNSLGSVIASDKNGSLLAQLNNVQYLEVSSNSIFYLPWRFFKGLYSLERLVISDNKISSLNFDLSHMKSLNFIDVSKNSISWISRRTRDDLDSLASRGKIVLDLTFNPLPCTCSGIKLLDWISNTKVCIISRQYLTCLDEDGGLISLQNMEESIRLLKRQCATYPAIIIGCICGVFGLFLALLTSALVYRMRWRLLYTINNGFLAKLFGFKPSKRGTTNGFKFDAYVMYDEEDRDFVLYELLEEMESKRRHRLCVEDRDFLPGTFMFNNTNSAVQNSATTVFVVTENLVQSKEYQYALQAAMLEEYYSQGEKRDVCLLLMYGNVSRAELPKEMQMLMMKDRFLSYPITDETVAPNVFQGFWDRLSNSIGFATIT